jgi:hypothetical protein
MALEKKVRREVKKGEAIEVLLWLVFCFWLRDLYCGLSHGP